MAKTFLTHARAAHKFGKCHHLTLIFEMLVGSAVVCLLSARGPTAISGFVVAIVVDAVERHKKARTFPHVLKEALKAALGAVSIKPSVADGDAEFFVVQVSTI
jgi:hypothetical protein